MTIIEPFELRVEMMTKFLVQVFIDQWIHFCKLKSHWNFFAGSDFLNVVYLNYWKLVKIKDALRGGINKRRQIKMWW